MRAVLCREWGPPEGLVVVDDLPEPVAGPGQAVVRVHAAALNFFDTLIIQQRYQVKPALPFSPSAEVAGVVETLGPDTDGPPPGTCVLAYVGHGGAREKVVVAANRLTPVPYGVGDEVAAGLVVAYGTTLYALRDRAALRPGETLAVLGASGGVGLAAIELGKVMGARVIAVAAGTKLDACRAMGADETVDYETEDLKERLRGLTGGRGVDVVYDAVGDRFTEPAVRALAWGGRLLVIGFAAGEIPRVPLNLILLKSASLVGVHWGGMVDRDPARLVTDGRQLLDWVVSGAIRPRVVDVVPLEGTADAIRRLAERKVTGKLVVRP